MPKLFAFIAFGVFVTASLHASEPTPPLTIDMTDPKVRISIPGIPGIDMEVHPENAQNPMFRLLGTSGKISVSIITPGIEEVVSPISCASAVADVVLAQPTVSRDQMFLGRANERTFLIIYGLPRDESVLLSAHIVSAAESTHCVEAHVWKISTSDADIEPWFNGFGESSIEAF